MGAYENSMHEEGSCKDFAHQIIRMVDEMLVDKNRPALYDMFFACREIELQYRRNKEDGEIHGEFTRVE